MDLGELVDPSFGLRQNEWTISGETFGEHNQISLIGWSGYNTKRPWERNYIVHCNICSKDSELFGGGYFKANDYSLRRRGHLPCGCTLIHWSINQYEILCGRVCKENGKTLVKVQKSPKSGKLNVTASCEEHGEWTVVVSNFLHKKGPCPGCSRKARGIALSDEMKKPDETFLDSFFASGKFPPGSIFCRSESRDKRGDVGKWLVKCPICLDIGEAKTVSLRDGCRPCSCRTSGQRECYINLLFKHSVDYPIAAKFGVAGNSLTRTKKQNLKSSHSVVNYFIYKFPSVLSCRDAELRCKRELECGVIPKDQMLDGWTETTWVYNLGKIVEIYESFGGVLIRGPDVIFDID